MFTTCHIHLQPFLITTKATLHSGTRRYSWQIWFICTITRNPQQSCEIASPFCRWQNRGSEREAVCLRLPSCSFIFLTQSHQRPFGERKISQWYFIIQKVGKGQIHLVKELPSNIPSDLPGDTVNIIKHWVIAVYSRAIKQDANPTMKTGILIRTQI